MKRTHILMLSVSAVATLVVTSAPFAGAGAPDHSWTSSPVSGPSPNTISVSGTGCQPTLETTTTPPPPPPRVESAGLGGSVVAQPFETGTVTVFLRDVADTMTLHSQTYPATDGNWGGPFSIPAGLAAGTYPLEAACSVLFPEVAGVAVTLGGATFGYPDRSYTVIAQARRPEPVDAEVTFTG